MTAEKRAPILLLPFVLIWDLVAWILRLTGRLIAAILGLTLMIVGLIATMTVIGAIVGIPLMIFGFMLMLRSVF